MAKLHVRVTIRQLCVLATSLAWSHLAFPQDPPDPVNMCTNSDLATGGCEFWNISTAYAYAGDQREFGWVPDPDDMFRRDRMFYRVEIRSVPAEILVMTAETAVAQENIFWTPQSTGHYHLKVMACDPDLDPVDQCSEWGDSMNDENTPADLPGWVVYAAIKPPSGGGIE
jgi:hypothetical protein